MRIVRKHRFFLFCAFVFAVACMIGVAVVRGRASRETQITVNIVTYSQMPDKSVALTSGPSGAGTARPTGVKRAAAQPTDEEYEAAARIISNATGWATDAASVKRGIEEYNAAHASSITPAEYAEMALTGALVPAGYGDGQVLSNGWEDAQADTLTVPGL